MRLLWYVAHALLIGNQVVLNPFPIEEDLARGHLYERGNHFHGGGFAGAVRAQVAGDLAGAGRKADVIDCNDAGESFRNVAKFEHNSSLCCFVPYVANYYQSRQVAHYIATQL